MPAEVLAAPRSSGRGVVRLVLLLCLLVGESLVVSFRYDAWSLIDAGEASWFQWLGYSGHVAKMGVVFFVAFLLAIGPRLEAHYDNLLASATGYPLVRILIAQLIAYAAFLLITHTIFANPATSHSLSALLPLLWLSMVPLVIGLWLIVVAPIGYWLQLMVP